MLFATRALRTYEPEAWKKQGDVRAGGFHGARGDWQRWGPQCGENVLSIEPSDAVSVQKLLDPSTGHTQHVPGSRNGLKQCP